MSDGMNKVLLLGHLGADPEVKTTSTGHAVCHFRIATTESYLDKDKNKKERTEWHRITVWGRRGEALAKILTKGTQVLVEGRLETSSYEKNGEKRYSTTVIATDVFLGGGKRAPSVGYSSMIPIAPTKPQVDAPVDVPF
jgi:single-strand DNA-binding protein